MGIKKDIIFLPVKTKCIILFVTSDVRSYSIGVRVNLSTDRICSVPWEDLSGVLLMLHKSRFPTVWREVRFTCDLYFSCYFSFLIKAILLFAICSCTFLIDIQKEPCTSSSAEQARTNIYLLKHILRPISLKKYRPTSIITQKIWSQYN